MFINKLKGTQNTQTGAEERRYFIKYKNVLVSRLDRGPQMEHPGLSGGTIVFIIINVTQVCFYAVPDQVGEQVRFVFEE